MPGTGKSTVGVILAKQLGYDFIDTDISIAYREKRSLPQIIAEQGVDALLRIEGEVGEAIDCERTVIATGGSMVLSPGAMEKLKKQGVVIWLRTPLEELERRFAICSKEDRGVAAPVGTSTEDIYALRRPLYEKYADIIIDCAQGTENCVKQLMDAIAEYADSLS